MTKKYLLFFILICIEGFSQRKLTEKQIDSLQNTIFTTNSGNADKIEAITTELYYQSKEIDYKKGQINALLRRAAHRVNIKDFDKVQPDLNEAVTLSNDIEDYYSMARAKTIEAAMLNALKLYSETQKVLDQNLKLIPKIKDINKRRLMETLFYGRYINLYGNQNMEDSVHHYAEKRMKAALLLPNSEKEKPIIILSTARLFCVYYKTAKDFKKLEHYINIQEKYINQTDNLFDLSFYHKTKADFIYNYQKNTKNYLDTALEHYKLAEKYADQSNNLLLKEAIYPNIAKIYEDKKNEEKQVQYLNKYTTLKDSVVKKENKTIEKLVFQPRKEDQVKPILPSEGLVKSGETRFMFIYLILAALLVLFLLFIFFRRKNKNNDHFSEDNNTGDGSLNEKNQELRKLALENNIAFLPSFLELYPEFKESLLRINPALINSDIEFCALLKLKLNSQQIAASKKISVRAVDSKKYRIRKKLNILSSENLYHWMADK